MKTLYIHGLDSSPREDKLNVIREHSEVVALHLDYRTKFNSYQMLSELVVSEGINRIVGSSLGGYLGYWLSKQHDISCLLFNPALGMQSVELLADKTGDANPCMTIILGAQDDIVNPQNTRKFIGGQSHVNMVIMDQLGHQIDMETFRRAVGDFWSKK